MNYSKRLYNKLTKDYLMERYIHKSNQPYYIAKLCKCSICTVMKYLRKYDIPLRKRGIQFKGIPLTKKHKLKLSKSHLGKKLSEKHKKAIKNALSVHHIDGNHKNNSNNNLIKVKNKTHQKMYKIYYTFIVLINKDKELKKWLKMHYTNK